MLLRCIDREDRQLLDLLALRRASCCAAGPRTAARRSPAASPSRRCSRSCRCSPSCVALLSRAPFFEQVLVQIKIFLLLNLVPEIAGKHHHRLHGGVRRATPARAHAGSARGALRDRAGDDAHRGPLDQRDLARAPLAAALDLVVAYVTLLVVGPLLIARLGVASRPTSCRSPADGASSRRELHTVHAAGGPGRS